MTTSKNESFDVWLKNQEGYKNCIKIYKEQKIEIHLHELLYIKPAKFNQFFYDFSKARTSQIYNNLEELEGLYDKILFKENEVIYDKKNLINLYILFSKFGYIDKNSEKNNVHNLSWNNIISIYLRPNIK